MSYVVSITNAWPPPRYDVLPWTHVKVEEATSPTATWAAIDDQPLSPLDENPATPAVRNVTTAFATLEDGWYRLVFFDASGARSEPLAPVRSITSAGELPPTPDEVRTLSPLLRKKYPLPPNDPYELADLRVTVYQAIAHVQSITWRILDPTLGDPAPKGYRGEPVPPALVPTALQAVASMAERLTVQGNPVFAERAASGRLLRSFSAGPYSETYFAPGEFMRRGVVTRPAMDVEDGLDAMLWALATEDARDYFVMRSGGAPLPAGAVIAADYRRMGSGYGAGGPLHPRLDVGPDGW